MKLKKLWRLWALALGQKAGDNDRESDIIGVFRTLIVLCYIITNITIVLGLIRHW